jgi:hypothetical protein
MHLDAELARELDGRLPADLGYGRIVASETEVPNMNANMV